MSVSDLTGTSWNLNSSISRLSASTFYVNGTFDSVYSYGTYQGQHFTGSITSLKFQDSGSTLLVYENTDFPLKYSGGWEDVDSEYSVEDVVFTFTGGTDATNSTLIAWLEANATQVVDPVYTQKGVLTLSNPTSNVSFSISGVSSATVGITISNSSTTSNWSYTRVYDDYSSSSGYGNLLYTASSADFNTSVSTLTGKIIIATANSGSGYIAHNIDPTTTGGVSYSTISSSATLLIYTFTVNSDGTLTITNLDYDG